MRSLRVLPVVLACLAVTPLIAPPAKAQMDISLNVNLAPPPIPIYSEPALPSDGYMFIPGYWAWNGDSYYWVPGTWVLPPQPGLLWTPGWWEFVGPSYRWHAGYWGPTVGYYGGINYGFGYYGHGYEGGRWNGGHFFYNSAVHNFGRAHITNVYRSTVVNNHVRTSYVGEPRGTPRVAAPEPRVVPHDQRTAPAQVQTQHENAAGWQRRAYDNVNHGRPPVAASQHPSTFSGRNVVPAHNVPQPQRPAPQQRQAPPQQQQQHQHQGGGQPNGGHGGDDHQHH